MKKTIMTVDDSCSVRQMLSKLLEEAGFQVVTACDGQDAVEKLQDSDVNLVITDLNMPRMDGISLIKSVRESSVNRFVPIIMLTTESDDRKRLEGKQAGATGWIVKPFSTTQLLSAIRMTLA